MAELPVGPPLLRAVLEVVDRRARAREQLAHGRELRGLRAVRGAGDRDLVVVEVVVALDERDRLDRLRATSAGSSARSLAVASPSGRRRTCTRCTASTTSPRRTVTLIASTDAGELRCRSCPRSKPGGASSTRSSSDSPIEKAGPAHIATLKTFDPPLSALDGEGFRGVERRAKRFLLPTDDDELVADGAPDERGPAEVRAAERRRARRRRCSALRFADGGELQLTEAGSKKRAGVWLLRPDALARRARAPRAGGGRADAPRTSRAILASDSRRLHSLLRDQRLIAGIGRAWANEILWAARSRRTRSRRRSTTTRPSASRPRSATRWRAASSCGSQGANDAKTYRVHNKLGEPCARCGTPLARVDFEEHTIYYCPTCQTGGRVLEGPAHVEASQVKIAQHRGRRALLLALRRLRLEARRPVRRRQQRAPRTRPGVPRRRAPKTTASGGSNTEFGARDWTLPAKAEADGGDRLVRARAPGARLAARRQELRHDPRDAAGTRRSPSASAAGRSRRSQTAAATDIGPSCRLVNVPRVIRTQPQRGGWLEVVCGPMFSGKSEELIRRLRRAEIAGQRALIVKPLIDDRYDVGHVVSHAGAKMRAVTAQSSDEVLAARPAATTRSASTRCSSSTTASSTRSTRSSPAGARVVAAGLAQDFRGLPFGAMPTLLCVAEFVDKLEAVCHRCGGPATMTQRLVDGAARAVRRRDDPGRRARLVRGPLPRVLRAGRRRRGHAAHGVRARVVPEAHLVDLGAGLTPAFRGWFIVNARDAEWWFAETRGGTVRVRERVRRTRGRVPAARDQPHRPPAGPDEHVPRGGRTRRRSSWSPANVSLLVENEERPPAAVGLLPRPAVDGARVRRRRRRAVRPRDGGSAPGAPT